MFVVGSESLTFSLHGEDAQLFITHKKNYECLRGASITINRFHFAANFCHAVDFGPFA